MEKEKLVFNRPYTESIFYNIELTAKYIKRMGLNHFNNINFDINPEEFLALNIISLNPNICQRDLAKKLLKDRGGTGRILNSLEEKELIVRFIKTKNNRIIKTMEITQKGLEKINVCEKILTPSILEIKKEFTNEDEETVKELLEKLRNILAKNVKTQI